MCDVSPARWRLLPSGINVILVSSAQRVGRVSHKTQGFHFINCRVYRVRERVSHKTQGFRFINCRVYRVVERVSHKTRGFHFINLLSFYTTNSITSSTVAVTLSRSTSNATSASNSSATWRCVTPMFSRSSARRRTLFTIVARITSTRLLTAVKFACVLKTSYVELAAATRRRIFAQASSTSPWANMLLITGSVTPPWSNTASPRSGSGGAVASLDTGTT